MAKTKKQPKQKRKLTAEEREDLGKWARRVSQAVREFEKAAGKTINEDELRPWDEISENDRENYRKGGEAFAGGTLRSEQFMWDQLALVRAEMGEKAFRQKMFSICIDLFIQNVAPDLPEHKREEATTMVLNLAGMLEVPNEENDVAVQMAVIKQQLDRVERKIDGFARPQPSGS